MLLAMGGGSWAKLGSDGRWVEPLRQAGVLVHDLVPANCGFEVLWSDYMKGKYAGEPIKSVEMTCEASDAETVSIKGEFVITGHGIEGSLVYAQSRLIRQALAKSGAAIAYLDLTPDIAMAKLNTILQKPTNGKSIATVLKTRLGIQGARAALLRECAPKAAFADITALAAYIKRLPLTIERTRPLDEAISSAGGVAFDALDQRLMIRTCPAVFCAGEMLDWEAPTGGYLFTGCFATASKAAAGIIEYLQDSGY
jgi:uncharacterized flavoprotein (TIGR03862 family)